MVKTHDLAHLDALVDRHMKLREVSDRITAQNATDQERSDCLEGGPFITISRQLGAGGSSLANRLAGELNWQLFDKEILEAIARNAHTRMRVLDNMDEHLLGRLEEFINHLIVPESINQVSFIKEMSQVILSLGRVGNTIILGRGANWLLANDCGVRVRLVASLEARVRRIMARRSISEKDARKEVLEEERSTAEFIRRIFDRDVDDPLGYDMVLNLDRLSEDAAASAVHSLLHRLPVLQAAGSQ